MGYYMELMESKFKMKSDSKDKALDALKDLAKRKSLVWVYNEEVKNASTFEEAMQGCRWAVEDKMNSIYFEGEKYGDDDLIFNAIAPYVEDGSYIQINGEDGAIWRWVFENGKCFERQATLIFE